MNPVIDEPTWKRVRRGAAAFVTGLAVTLGVAWASALGLEDRDLGGRLTPLDLSRACEMRDGPAAVAYFGGPTTPTSWRCARVEGDDWITDQISPQQGCELLHGSRSRAQPAEADSPFAWYCRW